MSGSKKFSYLAYIGPLWILGVTMDKIKDKAVRFHCNQGLMLFILELISTAIYIALKFIPFYGELCASFFGFIAFPVCGLYTIVGLLNVLNNRLQPLPYIGLVKFIR